MTTAKKVENLNSATRRAPRKKAPVKKLIDVIEQPSMGKFLTKAVVEIGGGAAIAIGGAALALKCAENLSDSYKTDKEGNLTKRPKDWKERGEAAANLIGYAGGAVICGLGTTTAITGVIECFDSAAALRKIKDKKGKKK